MRGVVIFWLVGVCDMGIYYMAGKPIKTKDAGWLAGWLDLVHG
jgi:hypothetical protein